MLQEFYWQATQARGNVRLVPTDAAEVARELISQPVKELSADTMAAAIAARNGFRSPTGTPP